MADVARAIIKTAATHGFWEVFNLVDTWWAPEDEEGKEEKFRTGCGDSLAKAIEGGHLAITRDLLEGYDCDYSAGLDLALKLGRDHAAAEIYQSVDDPYMVGHLRWAARHGSMRVLKYAYEVCRDVSLFEAMGTAASRGHLEIVEFLLEKCKYQLLRVERDRDASESPLAKAIMHGQVEIGKYLYACGGYADCSLDDVKVVVAARGPLELVELFHKDGLYDASSLCEAFEYAGGGGKVDIMEFLQTHGGCTITSFEKAFMKAATNGRINAMDYLFSLDGHTVSTTFTNQAFVAAARDGCLDSVKFLNGKKPPTNTIMGAVVGGRVDVMEFLYGNGCITSEKVNQVFVAAAHTGCVDVLKYLYTEAHASPSVVDAAFERAADHHVASAVEFLLETGAVSPGAVEKFFRKAIHGQWIYDA
ncbi:hypothetical protein PHYSODRAFT_301987 [Phytophthora sojae]|uniref:Uncharacterized protein n=1 Tax=Phytophthora sojae (strain P6497) TaxID=1094619 RepID=G4ZPE9_PHYSP|nr:hypothetical protein PHYSODRAFT_301987 [Phytophthora sojae]EGZ15483.1 hypothetical protein PHYSODRAFT_301987 [Phytophthora sojae]|eukprot:XP_009529232.1 hypothetical protein PHYSODRAFT_301987 [Phytophthora sojae]